MGYSLNTVAASPIDRATEVTNKIDRYIELRALVNEQKTLGSDIKKWLEDNCVAEVKSPSGNIARLNPGKPGKKFFTWAVDKLQAYLKPKHFKLACPPTADSVLLDQMCADDPKLLKCGEWDMGPAGKPTLEIIEVA